MKTIKWKRWLARTLAITALVSQLALPTQAAEENPGGKERTGLWITEIYQNDVDRSAETGKYGSFSNKDDHMEFVEITNTAEEDIDFTAGGYGLWYYTITKTGEKTGEEKKLTVTTVEGNTDGIVIPAGESAVFWNQRSDLGDAEGTDYASEEQFRAAMLIPGDVPVYKISAACNFAANKGGFVLKDSEGNALSEYAYNPTTDEVTADGLAVHLKIPETGSTMSVWQAKKLTSAGLAYSAQLSGQRTAAAPDDLTPEGLYITELRPNDSDRSAVYGSGTNDLMECLELMNTTDKPIDLNEAYELAYRTKEGQYKAIPLYHYAENEDPTLCRGSDENCTVLPHSAVVLWCYRAGYGLKPGTDFQSFPTLEDFRSTYDIPEQVPVYIFTDQNGLGNTERGFELYRKEQDGSKALVSRYFWDGVDDLKNNKSVDLKISLDGPLMEVYAPASKSNLGTVSDAQITFQPDDGSYPQISLSQSEWDTEALRALTEGIGQGENLNIPYSYSANGSLPVTSMELFWKTDKMEDYSVTSSSAFYIYNKLYAFVQNGDLQGADSVEYYVRLHNAYRYVDTPHQTVEIHNDTQETGLRVSLNGADVSDKPYAGTVEISAQDYSAAAAQPAFSLDGTALDASTALDNGAYFVFDYKGVDSYFKNALTTGGDTEDTGKIVGTFSKCRTLPTDGCLAIPVGQQYFVYQEDGAATIELALRPATYGSCWEAYTDENNEDFVASNLRLVLRDGTVLTPTACTGENITTREVGDVDPVGPIKIGDSAGQYIYVKSSFTVPAEKIKGQAVSLDTTALADGAHTLTVTAGEQTETIDFTVCNTEPVAEKEKPTDLTVSLELSQSGDSATVAAVEGAAAVSVRKAKSIEDFQVFEGAGDSTANATAKTDSGASVSDNGQYPYQLVEIPVTGQESAVRVQLKATDSYEKDVQLYALKSGSWELLEVDRDGDTLTAIVPTEGFVKDGKVSVLVQARTTAYTPYTQADTFQTQPGDNAGWDGTATPEKYDFSIAWYTDTQYYSEQYNQHYEDMVGWIIENKDAQSIQYVLHTGDIADEFNEEYQFAFARSQQARLEAAGIPSGVLGGNHDVAHGNMVYDYYWKYFGEEYYQDKPYYGGSYKNNLGHYDVIEVDGEELLIISISWDIYTDEIAWINSVLDAHPGVRAIITTHGGINATAAESYTSRILQNGVCKNHPQVMAILNGHFHGSSVNFVELTSDNGEKHTLYQICTDYQSAAEGGCGYIKMLYFDLANDKIYLNSYSPSVPGTNAPDFNYYDDKSLVFSPDMLSLDESGAKRYTDYDIDIVTLPVDFDRETEKTLTVSDLSVVGLYAEEVGTASVESGQPTQVSLSGAAAGEPIYAVLLDEAGNPIAYTDFQTLPGASSRPGSGSSHRPKPAPTQPDKPDSAEPVVKTATASDGTVTTTTTWEDGKQAVAVKEPDGDTAITVTAAGGETMAEVSIPAEPGEAKVFEDVQEGSWYKDAVDDATRYKLFNGTSETTFAPNAPMTRGMLVQVLYHLSGNPKYGVGSGNFDDVQSAAWYSDAVGWAFKAGVVNGTSATEFSPDVRISREQLVTMLYRYAQAIGSGSKNRDDLSHFPDSGKVASFAQDAMQWAVAEGLIVGRGDGIAPQGTATRAEVATVLTRFTEYLKK